MAKGSLSKKHELIKIDIVSNINPTELPIWQNSIFLTFEIDWAQGEVLEDTIHLVEKAGVAATWFVTHQTPLIDRLRSNAKFELGIHPNFNYLLQGDSRNGRNAEEVVDLLMQTVSMYLCSSKTQHLFN